jgi:hypothetical protein
MSGLDNVAATIAYKETILREYESMPIASRTAEDKLIMVGIHAELSELRKKENLLLSQTPRSANKMQRWSTSSDAGTVTSNSTASDSKVKNCFTAGARYVPRIDDLVKKSAEIKAVIYFTLVNICMYRNDCIYPRDDIQCHPPLK